MNGRPTRKLGAGPEEECQRAERGPRPAVAAPEHRMVAMCCEPTSSKLRCRLYRRGHRAPLLRSLHKPVGEICRAFLQGCGICSATVFGSLTQAASHFRVIESRASAHGACATSTSVSKCPRAPVTASGI